MANLNRQSRPSSWDVGRFCFPAVVSDVRLPRDSRENRHDSESLRGVYSSENRFDDSRGLDTGQAEIQPLMPVGEALMIDA